ncbi:MAG TPA: hypothetical protein DEW35_03195 [Ruminococcaceae bacterium]|nr:hypothetical protein [Oscillospiraceae bacterium]
MKDDIKISFSLFLNLVVVTFMCAVLIMSISPLNRILFKVGYTAYVKDGNNQTVEKYTHYSDDGEDKIAEKYESDEYRKKGYTVLKDNIPSKAGKIFDFSVLTVLSLIILIAFVYNKLYTVGNKDFNSVKCGRKDEDKLRGLKIGIMAMIPDFIVFLIMLLLRFIKPSTTVGYYKIFNAVYFKILNLCMGSKTLGDVSFFGFAVMFLILFIVPLIAHISYTLGYKDIKIYDKITYKKGEIK